MAVQDCNEVSNIMAIKILAWDDDLAKQVAELSKIKNYAYTQRARLKEAWEKIDIATWKNANELELMWKSAEIKIDAIVQSRILQWDAWQEAYMELAKQINNTKWSLVWWVNLLEKVKNAPVLELDDIARLWEN